MSEKFKEVTGKLLKSPAQTLSNLKERRRYLLFAVLQDGWSFWCGLGYHLPSASVTEYASANLFVEVLSGSNSRHEIIKAIQEIAEQRGWYDVNLSNLGAGWSRVGRGRSLRDFLSSEDHVAEIKKFFLESLEELREIKEQYPHLPWGGST